MKQLVEFINKLVASFLNFLNGLKSPDKPKVELPKDSPIKDPQTIIAPKTFEQYKVKFHQARILPQHLAAAKFKASKIMANKDKYLDVQDATGVPWYVVASIHSLESGLNFQSVLHNGEAIIGTGKKTTLVPKGKGPFSTWSEAAIDALGGKAAHFNKKDWGIGEWLDFLERYNGLGYRRRGLDSPYLWSMTSEQRTAGKYVADGIFDPKAISKQVGCVAIIKSLIS